MSTHIPSGIHRTGLVVSEHWSERTVILGCAGVLDMLTAPDLEGRIVIALDKQPKSMIVDLTLTTFLASCGMNVLVGTHQRCHSTTTDFAVVADGHVTKRPMELVGLTDILTVHATLGEALGTLAA
jgi:anti-anti-sigma factor